MSPGSAEALPDDASIIFVFFGKAFTAEGALGPPLFIPSHPMALGSLKEQEPHLWSLPFVRFGTCCASEPMGLVTPCRGVIQQCVANMEGTENHFHVPATSSEALSADR